MKSLKFLLLAVLLALVPADAGFSANEPDSGQIAISVARLLEQGHYTRKRLSEEGFSPRLLRNYLEMLDFNHLFFTQKDVDSFSEKYAKSLADDVLLGNTAPAFDIFDLYVKRVEGRVAQVKDLLKTEFTFDSDRTIELNRQKSRWPKDDAEAQQLWHDRIEGELLQEKLNEKPKTVGSTPIPAPPDGTIYPGVKEAAVKYPPAKPVAPADVITRRYEQLLRNVHDQTHEDVVKTFLTTLAQSYDPHSEYMSRSELENFSINMRLSLVGIGAVLQSDEGYAKIMDLVPGGPAQMNGKIKVGDRVSAVAQGSKDFVDVIGMKLDKVVEMIRGAKGTTVRLQIISSHAADPSERKIVEIVRDEIKLKEQEAKAEIVEKEINGRMQRLGWITLPSFYADMENLGSKNSKSTTRDVLVLLNRLKQENISGLVMDLRKNGGGSLEESVNLTGLFIKKGPVVQAKDANGNIHVSRDRDSTVAYDGPLVVLTNRLSASASEIFAAALQDYGRAVIVGDANTFGKGTVQTMLEIGRFIPLLGGGTNEAGALKLTIQKFYRVAGGSTQFRGVISDIKLPSLWDHPDIGEGSLKNPLPYDEVDPVSYDKYEHPLAIKELRARSAARVAADREFKYVVEDLTRTKQKLADNKLSLNEAQRREEIAQDKERKEKRIAERAKHKTSTQKVFQVTLDNVNKPELQPVKNDVKTASVDPDNAAPDEETDDELIAPKRPAIDPVRSETLNIVSDLIELTRSPKTASVGK